ncbi:MAG: DUF4340 domain-containing protein [Alphaproteobacteria bacterium]|nr:DUF4340 domain-containing protein [Alphaproteobacteria bacterium]
MRKRSFLTLAGITALAVAAAIVTQPSNDLTKIAGSGKVVAPDLVKSINDVRGITIARKKDTLTITRGKDGWRIKERGGYLVDPDKVKQLLVGLADMKTLEPKTDRKDLYERLELRDLAHKDSAAKLITVTGANNKTLAKLLIGKTARGRFGPGTIYYRKPGEKRAWKASGDLAIDHDPSNWIDKSLADIRKTRVRLFAVTAKDGETVATERPKPGVALALTTDPLPEGMVPKKDGTIAALANVLEKLSLEDVREAAKIDWATKTVSTAEIRTYDGIVVTARVAEVKKDEFWVSFEFTFDATGAIVPKGKVHEKMEIKTAAAAKKEVAELMARVKGWAYKLPATNLSHLQLRLKDVLEKKKTS